MIQTFTTHLKMRRPFLLLLFGVFLIGNTLRGQVLISEFQANPPGGDPAMSDIELIGTPGASFSGYILSIESDPGASAGLVDRATMISGTFDANGLLLVQVPDLENPSFTLVLVDNFTGTTSTDLDTDNNGTIDDSSTLGTVLDAIGIPDAAGEPLYGAELGGTDFTFPSPAPILNEPELVFRDGNGDLFAVSDLDATEVYNSLGQFVNVADFDFDPTTPTFGNLNPTMGGMSTSTSITIFSDFFNDDPFARVVNQWTEFSSAGEFTWSYDPDNTQVDLNPFSQQGDQCTANDFLISPVINLDNLDSIELAIEASVGFSGNDLEVFFSQDYDPSVNADPSSATLVSLGNILQTSPSFTSDGLDSLSGDIRLFIQFLNTDSNCASWSIDDVTVTATAVGPIVQFTQPLVLAQEGTDASVSFDVELINDPAGDENFTVELVSGDAIDLDNFATQNLVFNAGTGSTVTITVNITDDALTEGTEVFVFEITNADVAIGTQNQIALNLTDNDFITTPISQVQGSQHTSPLLDQDVQIEGVVTAVDDNGFYVQDLNPDGDDNTSEAIFVFTSTAPTVTVGNGVTVIGTVSEFGFGLELTTTQISGNPIVQVTAASVALPQPVVIGLGGRIPPASAIDDGALDDTFDPSASGADFFESLESMLVIAQNPVVVAPTNDNGETFTVVDGGFTATGLSESGTMNIGPGDFNPEKIQIDEDPGIFDLPDLELGLGTTLGNVTGIIDYGFGNYELIPTEEFLVIESNVPEVDVTSLQGSSTELLVASYNVLNLETNESDGDTDVADGRFDAIADQIINNLNTPDIIGLQEIQDNSGSVNDGITAADLTLQALVDAISAAGGPTYQFIDNTFITDGASGGQPGGNIRTAFLFNPARVDTVPGSVRTIDNQGPGGAFEGSRLPLVATFEFNDTTITIVNNHFSSKGGSAPLFGVEQPFQDRQEDVTVNGSLDERQLQAGAVADFVDSLLAVNQDEVVVVLGDLNEFEFVSPVLVIDDALNNLTNTIPENERYSFIFQGNSQSLDHILVSDNLILNAEFEILHLNTEFVETDGTASDHDPLIAKLDLGDLVAPPAGGQDEIVFQVNTDSDDAEEITTLDGARADAVIGFVDLGSSDLEVVDDGFNGSNQFVGVRFSDITIPQGAIIVDAFLRFSLDTDGQGSGNDTVNAFIQIEDAVNPGTFTDNLFDISSRAVLGDTVNWDIFPVTDEQVTARSAINTPSVATLIQQIVNREDWLSGNALSFRITGNGGERDFSSSTDDGGQFTPELVVNFLPVNGVVATVSASSDDAEEITTLDGARADAVIGFVDLGSSDLEVVDDGFNGSNQFIGIRFAELNIPPGAIIQNAFLQLTSDTDGASAEPVEAFIQVEDADDPGTFTDALFDISSRTVLDDTVIWNVQEITAEQQANREALNTPNLSELVQQIVNRPNWTAGNAISFRITGTGGERDFSSADDDGPEVAPRLVVDFIPVANLTTVAQSTDDAEEITTLDGARADAVIGFVDLGSSDLEVVDDGFNGSNQIIGLRFDNITLPPQAPIESAFIELTLDTDGAGSGTPVNAFIQIEDTDDAVSFTDNLFDVSSRVVLGDTVDWVVPIVTQEQVDAREALATADVSSLIAQIIARDDWQSGNALGFRITGEMGERDFSSADDDGPEVAPRLVINFQQSGAVAATPVLTQEIPDLVTRTGFNIQIDLNNFFEDDDSDIDFLLENAAIGPLPDGLELTSEGVIQGSLDEATFLALNAVAVSFGDTTVSNTFNIIVEPAPVSVLNQIGTVSVGSFDEGAAEISAFDPSTDQLFVTNAETDMIDIIDLSDPTTPTVVSSIDFSAIGGGVNSVAVSNGILAAAIEGPDQAPGAVALYNTSDASLIAAYETGALPDMVTFNNDGTVVLVANEGEPNDALDNNPEGSITLVDISAGADSASAVVSLADFTGFNNERASLEAEGARFNFPGATIAEDAEPEFITVLGDTAYVSLQENNAMAIVQISTSTVVDVFGLGFKDYSLPGSGLDPSNEDEGIRISNLPIQGLFQPDAITSLQVGSSRYVFTANEGDGREFGDFEDVSRIEDLTLDPAFFPFGDQIQEVAGRLEVTNTEGNGPNGQQVLRTFGARSFSVWDGNTGELVWDSGDDFEQITATVFPDDFNSDNDENDSFDSRSDDAGPEPEAVTLGQVGDITYAFIGLERIGGIMVYDVTDPTTPVFVEYFNNRDFSVGDVETEPAGDLGPEGLVFIAPEDSPNGSALLVVSNEVSGTVTVYEVGDEQFVPFSLTIFHNNDGESTVQPVPVVINGDSTFAAGAGQFVQTLNDQRAIAAGNGQESIMVSSGDNFLAGITFQTSIQDGIFYDALLLDAIDYDAIALGNHDFDFGTDILTDFINEFETNLAPYISANLTFENVPRLDSLASAGRIVPSTVIQRDGRDIGLIGLTTPILASISSPGNTTILDNVADILQAEVNSMQNAGVNIIILVSHLQGIDEDMELIAGISGVDVVIAGGGDELLSNDPNIGDPFNLVVEGSYPVVSQDVDGNDVFFVTTAGNYTYLGNLQLDFDDDGNVIEVLPQSDVILITGDADSAVVAAVEVPTLPIPDTIATSVFDLDARNITIRTGEGNLGNLIADALLFQARSNFDEFGVGFPDIALQNSGGIRTNSLVPAGPITNTGLFDITPFPNQVSIIEGITPEQLKNLMEWGVAEAPFADGRFPQISGFEVLYDVSRDPIQIDGSTITPGERVIAITLIRPDGTREAIITNGQIAEGAPNVNMISNDFTFLDGDAYPFSIQGLTMFTTLGATYNQAAQNFITLPQGLGGLVDSIAYDPSQSAMRIIEVQANEVNLSISETSVTEPDTVTITATASVAAAADLTLTVSVADVANTDFALSSMQIVIPAGQTTGSVEFFVLDDTDIEDTETAVISATGDSLTVLGVASVALEILDNDGVATVELSSSATAAAEGDVVTLTVTSSSAVTGAQTVDIAVSGIDAADFTLSANQVTIADGATSGAVTLTIVDDTEFEEGEVASVVISNPSAGISLGTVTSVDITLDDSADDPILGLEDELLESLNVFPNPATDELRIQSDLIEMERIEVYTIQGARVIDFIPNRNQREAILDVRSLKTGLYLIAIVDSETGTRVTRRIAIQ